MKAPASASCRQRFRAERAMPGSTSTGTAPILNSANINKKNSGDGRTKEAEAILRNFVSSPTDLVSKEQATIELARLIAKTNPTEARALVEPLSRTDRASVKRYAQAVLLTLPGGITPPAAPVKK